MYVDKHFLMLALPLTATPFRGKKFKSEQRKKNKIHLPTHVMLHCF
jgi:hypothetical protein